MKSPARVAFVTIATLLAAAWCSADRVINVEMAVGLKRVTELALSPDAQRVAYVVSCPRDADDDPGGNYSQIWLTDMADGPPRRLTWAKADASSPQFTPDSRTLLFRTEREEIAEHTQVYAMPIDGGEAEPLTEHETSVDSFRISPDGQWLAFTARDAQTDAEKDDEEAGRDWTVVDENLKHVRLRVMPMAGGDAKPVYEADPSTWDFRWLPDSSALVIVASQTPRTDDSMVYSSLYRVPREGGTPQRICESAGKLGDFDVTPDGKQLAYLGATSLNDPLPQSLFVVNVAGGEPRNVTDRQPFSCTRVTWLDDERVLLGSNLGANSSVEILEPFTRKPTRVYLAGPVISDWQVDPDTGAFAAVAGTPHEPTELYVGSITEKSLRRRSNHNPQLTGLTLARQDVVEWTGPDNFRIEGILTYPTDYEAGRRYPTIIHPHGGPEGVSQNTFSTFAQLLAARGYVVLQPNYRGSGGYGVSFSKGDHNDLGGNEYQDILAGLQMLIDNGITDPEHVGMAGWSYGGYLSAMAATHHSDKFKAAVMGAGISNWVSFAGTTDIPHEMSIVHWNQWAYDDFAMYWERSPLSAINNAHTPTLILHGADDVRVHPGQALELYTALKNKNVPTQLVFYPRSGHGVGERAHRIDLYQRQLDWFDKYVR